VEFSRGKRVLISAQFSREKQESRGLPSPSNAISHRKTNVRPPSTSFKEINTMPPKKKEVTEPTRRSTRVVSQSSVTTAKEPAESPKAVKKRSVEPVEKEVVPAAKKAKKGLGIGDKLPDLTLLDEEGNEIKIVDITFERGVILFAYPRASTPGCTKQVLLKIHLLTSGMWIP
jgi:hypothetical protein